MGDSAVLAGLELGADRLALGLAGIGGAWGPVDEAESLATLQLALARGVRVFDAAPSYGMAEQLLGRALAEWRGSRPIVSTKVGRVSSNSAHEEFYDFSSAGLRRSLEGSLRTLGLAQVDLLFVHEPQMVPPAERPRVVANLREFQAAGLTRRLGLAGGFGVEWDGWIESGAFDVVMLFRRLDPCILDGLADDVPRLRRHGMAIYGASPLHMGLLGARHDEFVRERPAWVWGPQIDRAIRLKQVADRHGLPLATLAHRFTYGLAELDRVVIGASNRRELESALNDIDAGPLPVEIFDAVCRVNAGENHETHERHEKDRS
ncbi:MAG: aldo/keto reductase [Opitutaceae bacterium]|nr:aldo/keto reductase [Opitutaceae bacterium]